MSKVWDAIQRRLKGGASAHGNSASRKVARILKKLGKNRKRKF